MGNFYRERVDDFEVYPLTVRRLVDEGQHNQNISGIIKKFSLLFVDELHKDKIKIGLHKELMANMASFQADLQNLVLYYQVKDTIPSLRLKKKIRIAVGTGVKKTKKQ